MGDLAHFYRYRVIDLPSNYIATRISFYHASLTSAHVLSTFRAGRRSVAADRMYHEVISTAAASSAFSVVESRAGNNN